MYIIVHDQHKLIIFGDESLNDKLNSIITENQFIEQHISSNFNDKFEEFKKDKIIIEAAGGMVFNSNNELLMIFRRGFWDMPKGKLDPGETIEECAIREVQEETGLKHIVATTKLQCTYHLYTIGHQTILKPSHWFRMEFHGEEKFIPQTEEDITEIKWVNKETAASLSAQMYPSILEMVLTYFLNPKTS